MTHHNMPKIFHDPRKNPPAPSPTYLMHGPWIELGQDMDTNILNILSMMMVMCNKQQVGNIWSWIHEKKRCLWKKRV